MAMIPDREVSLDVLYAYRDESDTISVQTRDRQTYRLGGNASKHLRLVPPFEKTVDGNIAIPRGYVQLRNTIRFHFADKAGQDRQWTACVVDGRCGGDPDGTTVGADSPPTAKPQEKVLRYCAATRGGEPGQRLEIPSPSSLDFFAYEVARREVAIHTSHSGDFPVIDIVVDVFCRLVEPE
jgi:hypothetical protein